MTDEKRPPATDRPALSVGQFGLGAGRTRTPSTKHAPERNSESLVDLVCRNVRGQRPHLLAYLLVDHARRLLHKGKASGFEWGDDVFVDLSALAERFPDRGRDEGYLGWKMSWSGRLLSDGELGPAAASTVPLGKDFNIACRCAAGMHSIDGGRLRSEVLARLEGQWRKIPAIDVLGVSKVPEVPPS